MVETRFGASISPVSESYEVQQNVYHPNNESENNMCISRLMHTFSLIILFVLLMVLTSKGVLHIVLLLSRCFEPQR